MQKRAREDEMLYLLTQCSARNVITEQEEGIDNNVLRTAIPKSDLNENQTPKILEPKDHFECSGQNQEERTRIEEVKQVEGKAIHMDIIGHSALQEITSSQEQQQQQPTNDCKVERISKKAKSDKGYSFRSKNNSGQEKTSAIKTPTNDAKEQPERAETTPVSKDHKEMVNDTVIQKSKRKRTEPEPDGMEKEGSAENKSRRNSLHSLNIEKVY